MDKKRKIIFREDHAPSWVLETVKHLSCFIVPYIHNGRWDGYSWHIKGTSDALKSWWQRYEDFCVQPKVVKRKHITN